jgi:hypothetical protein
MNANDSTQASDRPELPPKTISDRLDAIETGDELVFNSREATFEVVAVDRYTVEVVDPDGNRYTISQNLQTGGWSVHEEIWWVESADDSEGG